MYAVPHIISTKGNNKGSCRSYAEYLLKDNHFFFNHTSNEINLEDAISLIDENSKRRLTENDAKWFAPVYALSEAEAQYIAYTITGRIVTDYSELNTDEKIKYNDYIISLGKGFQDEMAKNFEKADLGIKSGKDLFYIGVVENKRKYTNQDEEVKQGLVKNGEEKKGFNTHIHIIQSRLANNAKQSKISPLAKHRKTQKNNLGAKVGFDRNFFSNRIEQHFDRFTQYVRDIRETFEYRKKTEAKKELRKENQLEINTINEKKYSNLSDEKKAIANNVLKNIQEIIIQTRITPKKNRKFIPKKEADRIINNASLLQYFQYLESVGLVKKERETDKDIYYKNLRGEIIGVNEDRWFNHGKKIGGKIIKAVQEMQNLEWMDALNKIIELNQEKINLPEIKPKKSLHLVSVNTNKSDYLFSSYNNLNLSKLYSDRFLKSISYNSNGKNFKALGFQNESGGFYTYNEKYNSFSKIGNADISIINGSDDNLKKDVVIFENHIEYMAYLQLNNISNLKESVLILNDKENIEKLAKYLKNCEGKIYSFANNYTLDLLKERDLEIIELKKERKSFADQLKEKGFNISEKFKKLKR